MPENSLVATSMSGVTVAELEGDALARPNRSTPPRLLAALLAIAAFVSLSALLSAVVLPLRDAVARGFRHDRERRALASQRIIHRAQRFWVGVLCALRVIRVRWEGLEGLQGPGPLLIVANHPSILDTCILVAQLPQADNVVEVFWAETPMLGGCVRHADYLRKDEGPRVVEEATRRLEQERVVLLFPEGTRSPLRGLGPFRRGAARIAIESGVPFRPVTIHCDQPFLKKGQKWYDVGDRPMQYTLRVGDPIDARRHLDGTESPGVAARKVTAALRAHFQESLQHGNP